MIILISITLLAGSFFCLLSALGCLRMKDSFARMHVSTKAVAFGGAILVICQMLADPSLTTIVFGVLVIGFFYMTLPLAAHMLGLVILRHPDNRARGLIRTDDREKPTTTIACGKPD